MYHIKGLAIAYITTMAMLTSTITTTILMSTKGTCSALVGCFDSGVTVQIRYMMDLVFVTINIL
jgi:hypothetical protein